MTLLFSVTDNAAAPAPSTTLAAAGLRERQHLQEWVLSDTRMLGDGLLVITDECDHWKSARGAEKDRLDVLTITADGRIAVVELKRDSAPNTVEVQALKYAALVSSASLRFLASEASEWRSRRGTPTTYDEARAMILAHVGQVDTEDDPVDDDAVWDENPQVILMAGSYHPTTVTTVLWLAERGVDVVLRTYDAYLVGEQVLVTVTQIYPVPGIEEQATAPAVVAEKNKQAKVAASRSGAAVKAIIAAELLDEGDELHLVPFGVAEDLVARWIAELPARGKATWVPQSPNCLLWSGPSNEWPVEWGGSAVSATALTKHIYAEAGAPEPKGNLVPRWATADGTTLTDLVGYSSRSGFDWTRLHRILEALPPGRWTTYGELAEVIGTAAQPLGNHVTRCAECSNAWRILGADGRSRPRFAWSDVSDARTQQDVLIDEGVSFSGDVADDALRLTASDLALLVADF